MAACSRSSEADCPSPSIPLCNLQSQDTPFSFPVFAYIYASQFTPNPHSSAPGLLPINTLRPVLSTMVAPAWTAWMQPVKKLRNHMFCALQPSSLPMNHKVADLPLFCSCFFRNSNDLEWHDAYQVFTKTDKQDEHHRCFFSCIWIGFVLVVALILFSSLSGLLHFLLCCLFSSEFGFMMFLAVA
jgi:hypothetical protein